MTKDMGVTYVMYLESLMPAPPARISATRPAPSTTTEPESPLAENGPDDLSKNRIVKSFETAMLLLAKYLRVYETKVVARPTVRPVVLPHLRSVVVQIVHLRFSHFILLDGTPKLQEAVVCEFFTQPG